MQILPASEASLQEACNVLRQGGVVAHATETCYGLACDLSNPKAVQRLFELKQRPPTQPVSALFTSTEEAKEYAEWSEMAEELAKENLPGPLTLILALREDAPCTLFPTPNGGKTIGIRISSHPTAMELVKLFGAPISTTSANVHKEPSPYTLEEMTIQPDLILDAGELQRNETSTVVTCLHGICTVVREGELKPKL